MGETNSGGAATSVDKNHISPFSPPTRAMGGNSDPVMNLVGNLMNIMTEFASSYKPTSGIPAPSVSNSVEETKASEPSNHGQSKKPCLHSPKQKEPAKSTSPLDIQPTGGVAPAEEVVQGLMPLNLPEKVENCRGGPPSIVSQPSEKTRVSPPVSL